MREFPPGAKHPDIDLIQLALGRAGYSLGAIDGTLSPRTQTALARFRGDRCLPPVSGISEGDWRALAPFLVGYVIREARPGDSLPQLAAEFRTTASAIQTANPGLLEREPSLGERLIIPLDFPVVPTQVRFTSLALGYVLQGLLARYPQISREIIGQSVAGCGLSVLRFGLGPGAVGMSAAHHGNEWITTPVLLKFLEEYAKAQAEGSTVGGLPARELYTASTLQLVPMVNPDGVDIASGARDSGPDFEYATYLSQNYPHIPFPDGWKANGRGVDLNLQYPAGWERAREIKFAQDFRLPGPRDYVGGGPLSEPESQALYDYTLRQTFQMILSYHSQGQVIYWQYLDFLPEKSREIGEIFATLSGYALEETPYESGHAGYKDWFIAHFDRPGYTIEVGLGENPLPLEQFDEIYADNVALLAASLVLSGPGSLLTGTKTPE